jgi:hypothetical protein
MVDYISFDYDMLKKIVERKLMVSTQHDGDKSLTVLKVYCTSVYHHFSNNLDQKCQRKNTLSLNAWTVNEAADLDSALSPYLQPQMNETVHIKSVFDSNAN